jgi:hypothetical protein
MNGADKVARCQDSTVRQPNSSEDMPPLGASRAGYAIGTQSQCRNGSDHRSRRGGGWPTGHCQDSHRQDHSWPRAGDRKHAGWPALRRSRASGRPAGLGEDQTGRNPRHRALAWRTTRAIHARPLAVRHSGRRSAGRECDRVARLPLHRRTGLFAAFDGRRDQSGKSPHPVGTVAGDAGASCHGCRYPS